MKSLMLLTLQLLKEFGRLTCTDTTKDSETILRRFEHEGVSFLTITLPSFATDFQKSLERGKIETDVFLGFKNSKKRTWLPAFLQGFTSLVFDSDSGVLLDNPSTEAIRAVRQITMLHGKVLLPCSKEREEKAFRDYLRTEDHVKEFDARRTPEQMESFVDAFSLLFANVVQRIDNSLFANEPLIPKHGPGATADRLFGNEKFRQRTWPRRLEAVFPQRDYIIPSERYHESLNDVRDLDPGDEIPVRVISVPKTLKTRRIIAIEPTAMQYMQQALMAPLVEGLEGDPLVGPLIGFTDQGPNKDLACEGSLTGALATLDLSSASDLVSNQLVRAAFSRFPHFGEAIDATRSRRADVPGKGVIRLAKFASMGSALCFPIEAMVFLTVTLMGVAQSRNTPITKAFVSGLRGVVRVYGDDIIVPADSVRPVIDLLESFGFLVGRDKSFWNGRFRESCGGDYYAGEDVTTIRCRRPFPTSRADADGMVSLVSFRNQCYAHGYWQTARWLDDRIAELLPHFPAVHPTSSVVGRHTFLPVEGERMCPRLHKPLVRGYVVSSKPPICEIDGHGALLKFFLKQAEEPLEEGHLRRSGRPDAVFLKLRWSSPV